MQVPPNVPNEQHCGHQTSASSHSRDDLQTCVTCHTFVRLLVAFHIYVSDKCTLFYVG